MKEKNDISGNGTLLSIVIVAYNCLPYLQKCVKSIRKYDDTDGRSEIIVVDNSDNNKILQWSQRNPRLVKYIHNENRGFGQANNVGAETARGKYLLFLNPDTQLIEPVFEKTIRFMDQNPEKGIAGVQLLDGKGRRNTSFALRSSWGFLRTALSALFKELNIFIPNIMFTSGADLFIRKADFEKIGRFDENIFLYFEETDLYNRADQAGLKGAFLKNLRIIHFEGKTGDSRMVTKYFHKIDSFHYLCGKYNLDFEKYARIDKRYILFKIFLLKLLGRKEKAEQYQLVRKKWNAYTE